MPSTFLAPRWSDPGSYEESLRLLRTNLEAAIDGSDHPVVLFTSAQPLRDRTGVSAALGISFALAGREVLLVDADLRAPRAHIHLHGNNSRGLADALAGKLAPEDAVQDVPAPEGVRALGGLQLMAGGTPVSNPTDLISGRRMSDLLESLALQVDLVLVDAPPVLSRADALVIAPACTGVVLVADVASTSFTVLNKAKDLLVRNRGRLFGVVANLPPRAAGL